MQKLLLLMKHGNNFRWDMVSLAIVIRLRAVWCGEVTLGSLFCCWSLVLPVDVTTTFFKWNIEGVIWTWFVLSTGDAFKEGFLAKQSFTWLEMAFSVCKVGYMAVGYECQLFTTLPGMCKWLKGSSSRPGQWPVIRELEVPKVLQLLSITRFTRLHSLGW